MNILDQFINNLKNQRFTTSGYEDIRISTFEFLQRLNS